MHDILGKILRFIGILFFSLTTLLNLLGGIGTSCAAFLTEQYPNYKALIDEGLQWLYQGLVITTILVGLAGIWIVVQLILGKPNAFRNALILLAIGTILAGTQYYFSLQLFGKAAPANMKFYINATTLILFLVYLIPGVKKRVNYSIADREGDPDAAGGLVAITTGALVLTTGVWAGPSHTISGENWVELLQVELNLGGVLLVGLGIFLLGRNFLELINYRYAFVKSEVAEEE